MTAPWQCARCQAQVAPGAPRCPECPSTEFTRPEAEDGMLKIARDGSVSDSAAIAAGDESFHVEGGFAGPEGLEVLKAPAEGAAAEAADASSPAVPPRMPPRRSPPPAVPRE